MKIKVVLLFIAIAAALSAQSLTITPPALSGSNGTLTASLMLTPPCNIWGGVLGEACADPEPLVWVTVNQAAEVVAVYDVDGASGEASVVSLGSGIVLLELPAGAVLESVEVTAQSDPPRVKPARPSRR